MTCVVIGGGGFIGTWLTASLLDSGRKVLVLGRNTDRPSSLDDRAVYVSGDYGDPNFLKAVLVDALEVIDLAYATAPGTSFNSPIHDLQANLPRAVNFLQTAAECGPFRKIVIVSSGGTIYGQSTTDILSEDHETNPVSPYGITKLAIEKYSLMYKALNGLPVVIARPANAYGEGQLAYRGQGFLATAAMSIIQGLPIVVYGGDSIIRDYIHAEDVSAGIKSILDMGVPGLCYNIGTGLGHTTNSVLKILLATADVRECDLEIRAMPVRRFDVLKNVLDSSLLLSHTGWHYNHSLMDGVARYWRWLNKI